MKNLITIIVPIYNSEDTIGKCINSILNQTHQNLELILINDGSTDSSLKICKEYSEKDQRIILIDKDNGGVASARNIGLDNASGEYIGFVDSDDFVAEEMYEKLLRAALENNSEIVECGYYHYNLNKVDTAPKFYNEQINNNKIAMKKFLKSENTQPITCNKIFHTTIIEDVRFPEYKYSEDYYFNVMSLIHTNRKTTIFEKLYFYVKNIDSVTEQNFSEDKFDLIKSGVSVLNTVMQYYPDLSKYAIIYILNHINFLYKSLVREDNDYPEYIVYKQELVKLLISINDEWGSQITKSDIPPKKRIPLYILKLNPKLYEIIIVTYDQILLLAKRYLVKN